MDSCCAACALNRSSTGQPLIARAVILDCARAVKSSTLRIEIAFISMFCEWHFVAPVWSTLFFTYALDPAY